MEQMKRAVTKLLLLNDEAENLMLRHRQEMLLLLQLMHCRNITHYH